MTIKTMLIFGLVNTIAIIFIYTVILGDDVTISVIIRGVITSVFALVIMNILQKKKLKNK